MWPSPCSKRYLNISRTRRISSLSAGIPFLPRHVEGRELHTSRTPTPDAFRWGRHHLGIRGRLFLGIGGRDHFGIRGRIASEFARKRHQLASRQDYSTCYCTFGVKMHPPIGVIVRPCHLQGGARSA
ncbi:hypothetical protein GHK03_35265 [Sinorhizobium medicae]|nr:hypothetical protein [Sinorhizobium medicae]